MNERIFAYFFWILLLLPLSVGLGQNLSETGERWDVLYEQGFEEVEEGGLPKDFFILDGKFSVANRGGRKCLVLPGNPVGENGLLFGPRLVDTDVTMQFSINMNSRGRRFSSWECAVGGMRGLRFRFDAGMQRASIRQEDQILQTTSFSRIQEPWTCVMVEVSKIKGTAQISAQLKMWQENSMVPSGWILQLENLKALPSGRFAIWGYSYSGEEIQWDDLIIKKRREHLEP